MGCDIHAKLEVYDKTRRIWETADIGIQGYLFERNYGVFGALAGVRRKVEGSLVPKGFPPDASTGTLEAYYDLVVVPDHVVIGLGEDYIYESEAKGLDIIDMGFMRRAASEGWHTPSWATTKDVEYALDLAEKVPIEWSILLQLMQTYEANGYSCRLVFWFDN